MLESATECHRAGELVEARRLYALCLAADPDHTMVLFRSGLLELQDRRLEAALASIDKAARAAPDEVRFQFGLGQVFEAMARWDEAAAAYRGVLRRDPASYDAQAALGAALHRGGHPDQAASAYRGALALAPDDPVSWGNLGVALKEIGDLEGAITALERGVALAPHSAVHAVNLGIALIERRDFGAAESVLRKALELESHPADAAFNLGNALRGLGRTREAAAMFRLAADSRPGHTDALNNLGNAYKELGDFGAALAAFETALEGRPDHVVVLNNAGCLLRTLGRTDEAEQMLRRGLAVDPGQAALHDNLGNVLKDAGALDEAIDCFRRALHLDPSNAATHGNLAYALSFQSPRPEPVREECWRWNARFAAPIRRLAADAARDLSPDRRLSIGYVSADFRDHCQTLFTIPLLARHDHRRFNIFCYSSVERPDAYTERVAAHADAWREVRPLDDERLSRVIRDDGIDILIDLTMHMSNGRPLLFARKPAPVQIAWLAYPGTTGMDAVDYRLSDPRLDPEGFDDHYAERTLRLPDSFWCYDPLTDEPRVGPLPALERGALTLGCLNNPCKLTDRTLELWSGVMRALPHARLLIMAPEGRYRQRVLERLAARAVGPQRVDFVPFRRRAEYLRTYEQIDFGLDTFPYNGHTTSLDALWMGVPTVTRVGETCVGRGGLSQLHQLGLAELAASSDQAFVEIAVRLAADLPRLAALRSSLRERLEASPLMDGARFARNIEAAYRTAWLQYVSGARRDEPARAPPPR
ncbi:MAG TPA: tetratricopeptide repeat protein [Steroidobacteraceae bacterium]|nr:tetratricopeptide repeat protein [Steroidobacteraceae bacterium]